MILMSLFVWNYFKDEKPKIQSDVEENGEHNFFDTFKNTRLLLAGIVNFLVSIAIYGFLFWVPTYMSETYKMGPEKTSFTAILYPLAGILSAILVSFSSGKIFKLKTNIIIGAMITINSVLIFIFPLLPVNLLIIGPVLFIVGLFAYLTAIIMTGPIAIEYAEKGKTSSAVGFMDAFGYIGASITGYITGYLVDNHGWNSVFYLWTFSCLAAAGLLFAGSFVYKKKNTD